MKLEGNTILVTGGGTGSNYEAIFQGLNDAMKN